VDWTTNLIVQIVAGFVGAHLAAAALHEQRFGWLGHSLVGAIAGAISGYFLQSAVLTVVTGSGSLNELRTGEAAIIEVLAGASAGAIATAAVGFLISEISPRGGP
jgi:uncharacterized membrane protein YeaQ/YmgE (transglycosylase-associated protein family)